VAGPPLTSRDAALPPGVAAAIAAQQVASERLIGLCQLAVVLLFGALYLLSPKTFDAADTFAPVPWALGAYLAFTLARVYFAGRGALPDWALYLSVAVDMALLFALIWSFHLQYGQPPSFYLKAPTLLYVFIFIALRALRFEARFVIAAGVLGALGWLALVIYAVMSTDGAMVTRDYVYYMTANSILIGAEVDKIVSILTVTAILAVAIVRGRNLLIRAVTEGAAARELSRFFAPEVVQRITAGREALGPGIGEVREAAILYCDMRGFTVLSQEIAPAALMALLADYRTRVGAAVDAAGGTVDKFLGDGVLAGFGAHRPSDTYAADALRAAEAIVAAVAGWNRERAAAGAVPVRIGVAVAAGRIVAGALGDPARLDYTVIGEPVNLAAKLEKHAKVAAVQALATADALARARAQGWVAAQPPTLLPASRVDGIAEPVDVVVIAR